VGKLKHFENYIRSDSRLNTLDKSWQLWKFRKHQEDVFNKIPSYKRILLIWHRRAGKDILALNYILKKSSERKGLYWHVYPTYSQGKKALWDAMDKDGQKFINAFHGQKNSTEMSVQMSNGSKYQIIGSDMDPSSIRGSNPVGVVFSEYSYMKPEIWDVVRPILSENGGWALFLYTPNGQNHAWDLYQMAKENKEWYVEKLGIKETKVIGEEEIKQLRAEGVSEELIQQEYYCEFLNYVYGSYFAGLVDLREKQGFITELNLATSLPVDTYWDIGNNSVIWFVQKQGESWCVVDYMEGEGLPLEYYLIEIKKKGYLYNVHTFPHDMINKEYTNNESRLEFARQTALVIGLQGEIIVQKKQSLVEGLETLRRFIGMCKIAKDKCRQGLKHLVDYKRAVNHKSGNYLDFPDNGQKASHAVDALRYAAIGCLSQDRSKEEWRVSKKILKLYNYVEY